MPSPLEVYFQHFQLFVYFERLCLFKFMIKILRKTHLTIALLTSVFIVLLSLSGALLIFAPSLDKLLFSTQWTVVPQGKIHNVAAMVSKVELELAEKVSIIEPGEFAEDVWRFRLQSGTYVNLDPYRLKITKQYTFEQHIYGFTMLFHRWLLYQDEQGHRPMQDWVSITALALTINVLIGFYLWFKPKAPHKRLKIKRFSNRKIFYSQLHSVLGVFFCIPLLLIAVSGIAFNWKTPTQWLVQSLTGSQIETVPQVTYRDDGSENLPLALLVDKGQAALKQGVIYRIYLPSNDQPLRLRIKMPQESHAYSWVWVDPKSAQVLNTYNAQQSNLATQVWHFKYKFHIGQFISPHMEWLWLIFSMSPILFLFTGLWLRLKRAKR